MDGALDFWEDELVFQGLPKSQTKFTVSNCTKISKSCGVKNVQKIYNILKVLIGRRHKIWAQKVQVYEGRWANTRTYVYLCIYESVLSKVFIFITQHNIRKQ